MYINFSPFPILTTNRLQLRQLVMDDVTELAKLRSDEQVNKYLDRPAAASPADAIEFIRKIDGFIKANKSIYWAISLKDDPALMGTICLWNFIPEKEMADIVYELLPDWQGKGIIQEALTEVIRYGFGKVQLKTIIALTAFANKGSVKLLKKNGFMLDEKYKYVSKEDAKGQEVYILTRPR